MMLRPQFVLRAASTCWRAGSLRHSPLLAGSANRRPAAPAACRWLSALAEGTEDDTSAVAADPPSAHPSARKSWAKVSPELFQEEYTLEEALAHIKENASAKFDETVDMQMTMGLDPRRADQQIRGMAPLPHNPGKAVKVAVFANPGLQGQAVAAGADLVGGEELMEQIADGSVPVDFTLCIATPAIMPTLGAKLGRLLGPKKLMPNVRVGTVTDDIAGAIALAQRGQAGYRLDKDANVAAGIGKVSMDVEAIAENARAYLQAVVNSQPKKPKGKKNAKLAGKPFVGRISMSSTMGRSFRIDRRSVSLKKSDADE